MKEQFRKFAEHFVSETSKNFGVDLRYDYNSVRWLDDLIQSMRPNLKKEEYQHLATALGSYLGETIIATYGGAWDHFPEAHKWMIRLEENREVSPFEKVYAQFENGAEDSILKFF